LEGKALASSWGSRNISGAPKHNLMFVWT